MPVSTDDQVNLVNCIISVKCGIQFAAVLKPGPTCAADGSCEAGTFSFTIFIIELLYARFGDAHSIPIDQSILWQS